LASLATRLSDLITAIGADIKSLKARNYDAHAASTAAQSVTGNLDTYIAGSAVTIPAGKIQVGTKYRCKFNAVKTGAGTQAPVITIRMGTLGTTAGDAAITTLTYAAQTAVIDEGEIEVDVAFRTVGTATAVVQAIGNLLHRLVTTGLNVTATFTSVKNTSGTFNSTTPTKIGLSLNVGASGSWTLDLVEAEVLNLAP
jgi:hypothetical protein